MHKSVFDELRVAYVILNSLFVPRLVVPSFVIGRKNSVLGYRMDGEEDIICLGKNFSKASLRTIFDDLLHQMCHIKNHMEGIKDQTESEYHNKFFLKSVLGVGLTAKRDSIFGWVTSTEHCQAVALHCGECVNCVTCGLKKPDKKIIDITEGLYAKILDNLGNEILKGRHEDHDMIGEKRYLFKFECGCKPPHNSIRSGRGSEGKHKLNIVCQDCGQNFKCKE
jgi:hypothetical protein